MDSQWIKQISPDGRMYYVNTVTGKSQWEAPVMPSSVLPLGWEEKVDPTGRRFYIDHNTKTTSWELPSHSVVKPTVVSSVTPPVAEVPWVCGSCTFHNEDPRAMKCAICETIRPPRPISSTVGRLSTAASAGVVSSVMPGTGPLLSSSLSTPAATFDRSEPRRGSGPASIPSDVVSYGLAGGAAVSPSVAAAQAGASLTPFHIPNERDRDCSKCKESFNLIRRIHHCKCCSRAFCHGCSSKTAVILGVVGDGYEKPCRVCDSCASHISSGEYCCVARCMILVQYAAAEKVVEACNAISVMLSSCHDRRKIDSFEQCGGFQLLATKMTEHGASPELECASLAVFRSSMSIPFELQAIWKETPWKVLQKPQLISFIAESLRAASSSSPSTTTSAHATATAVLGTIAAVSRPEYLPPAASVPGEMKGLFSSLTSDGVLPSVTSFVLDTDLNVQRAATRVMRALLESSIDPVNDIDRVGGISSLCLAMGTGDEVLCVDAVVSIILAVTMRAAPAVGVAGSEVVARNMQVAVENGACDPVVARLLSPTGTSPDTKAICLQLLACLSTRNHPVALKLSSMGVLTYAIAVVGPRSGASEKEQFHAMEVMLNICESAPEAVQPLLVKEGCVAVLVLYLRSTMDSKSQLQGVAATLLLLLVGGSAVAKQQLADLGGTREVMRLIQLATPSMSITLQTCVQMIAALAASTSAMRLHLVQFSAMSTMVALLRAPSVAVSRSAATALVSFFEDEEVVKLFAGKMAGTESNASQIVKELIYLADGTAAPAGPVPSDAGGDAVVVTQSYGLRLLSLLLGGEQLCIAVEKNKGPLHVDLDGVAWPASRIEISKIICSIDGGARLRKLMDMMSSPSSHPRVRSLVLRCLAAMGVPLPLPLTTEMLLKAWPQLTASSSGAVDTAVAVLALASSLFSCMAESTLGVGSPVTMSTLQVLCKSFETDLNLKVVSTVALVLKQITVRIQNLPGSSKLQSLVLTAFLGRAVELLLSGGTEDLAVDSDAFTVVLSDTIGSLSNGSPVAAASAVQLGAVYALVGLLKHRGTAVLSSACETLASLCVQHPPALELLEDFIPEMIPCVVPLLGGSPGNPAVLPRLRLVTVISKSPLICAQLAASDPMVDALLMLSQLPTDPRGGEALVASATMGKECVLRVGRHGETLKRRVLGSSDVILAAQFILSPDADSKVVGSDALRELLARDKTALLRLFTSSLGTDVLESVVGQLGTAKAPSVSQQQQQLQHLGLLHCLSESSCLPAKQALVDSGAIPACLQLLFIASPAMKDAIVFTLRALIVSEPIPANVTSAFAVPGDSAMQYLSRALGPETSGGCNAAVLDIVMHLPAKYASGQCLPLLGPLVPLLTSTASSDFLSAVLGVLKVITNADASVAQILVSKGCTERCVDLLVLVEIAGSVSLQLQAMSSAKGFVECFVAHDGCLKVMGVLERSVISGATNLAVASALLDILVTVTEADASGQVGVASFMSSNPMDLMLRIVQGREPFDLSPRAVAILSQVSSRHVYRKSFGKEVLSAVITLAETCATADPTATDVAIQSRLLLFKSMLSVAKNLAPTAGDMAGRLADLISSVMDGGSSVWAVLPAQSRIDAMRALQLLIRFPSVGLDALRAVKLASITLTVVTGTIGVSDARTSVVFREACILMRALVESGARDLFLDSDDKYVEVAVLLSRLFLTTSASPATASRGVFVLMIVDSLCASPAVCEALGSNTGFLDALEKLNRLTGLSADPLAASYWPDRVFDSLGPLRSSLSRMEPAPAGSSAAAIPASAKPLETSMPAVALEGLKPVGAPPEYWPSNSGKSSFPVGAPLIPKDFDPLELSKAGIAFDPFRDDSHMLPSVPVSTSLATLPPAAVFTPSVGVSMTIPPPSYHSEGGFEVRDSGYWNCSACTFSNQSSDSVCTMCEAPKAVAASAAAGAWSSASSFPPPSAAAAGPAAASRARSVEVSVDCPSGCGVSINYVVGAVSNCSRCSQASAIVR